jgi:hypothetical protein
MSDLISFTASEPVLVELAEVPGVPFVEMLGPLERGTVDAAVLSKGL